MNNNELLAGLLAYQLRLVSAGTLAWYAHHLETAPEARLLEFLAERKVITGHDRDLLERLLASILQAHHGDPLDALNTFGGAAAAEEAFARTLDVTEDGWHPHDDAPTILAGELPHGLPRQITPETVGRYTRGSEYARGGIGRILLVHDEQIGRDVILKELLPHRAVDPTDTTLSRLDDQKSPGSPLRQSASMLARFLQEAKITGQLEHPSIVPVYELGLRTDGQLYYTMKLVRGNTLSVAISQCKTIDQRLALLRSFLDVCQAMAYAHTKGVIHRDLKPSNIMVGEFGECVVLDWGLAKMQKGKDAHARDMERTASQLKIDTDTLDSAKTRPQDVLGTPLYMSPEQARGESGNVSYWSDVYSLGVILYEILTGEVPHRWTNTMDTVRRVGSLPVPPVAKTQPKTPPELAAICDKALRFDFNDRYSTAGELARDVEQFLAGAVVDAYTYSALDVLKRLYGQHKILINTTSLAAAAILIVGVFSYVNIYRERAKALAAQAFAEEQQIIAEDKKLEADAQRAAADEQRERAETAEEQTAREKYVSDIRLADVYVRDQNLEGASEVLRSTRPKQRGFEWGLLLGLCHQDLATLRGHTRDVFAYFSPDGTRILTLSGDSSARLWDAATDQTLFIWDFSGARPAGAAFNPIGTRVAIWMDGGQLQLYDTATGNMVKRWNAHSRRIHSCAFSPLGDILASVAGDQNIRLWNVNDAQLALEIPIQDADYTYLHYATGGKHLLAATRGRPLRLFDTQSGAMTAQSSDEAVLLREVGDALLVSVGDALALLSDSELDEQRRIHIGESVRSAMYSPQTAAVCYLSGDGILKLWDLSEDRIRFAVQNSDPAISFELSHDGNLALVLGRSGRMRTYDAQTGALVREFGGHQRPVTTAGFAPDDAYVLTASVDGAVKKWSPRQNLNTVTRAVLPEGFEVANVSANGARILMTTRDGSYAVLDLDRNLVVYQARSPYSRLLSANAISADGKLLVCANDDFLPLVIDVETGSVLSELRGHEGYIANISFSADASRTVTASWDTTARIWDTQSGAELATLKGHGDTVYTAAFSPDGRYIATGSRDHTAMVWDAATGTPIVTIQHEAPVVQCAFSPDSAKVITADREGNMLLRDIATPAQAIPLKGKPSYTLALTFNSDGTRLISEPGPNDLTIWDAQIGLPLTTPMGNAASRHAWRRYIPASNVILTATDGGAILQSLPFPPGPEVTSEDVESALAAYRSQRAAWADAPGRAERPRLTDYYLPSPTIDTLLDYLRELRQGASGDQSTLTLGEATPAFHPLNLTKGDVVTAIAGQAPAALLSEAGTADLDSLRNNTRDFEIDLLHGGQASTLRIHRIDVARTGRTINLTAAQARSLLEVALTHLQTGASTLDQVNRAKSAESGTAPEGSLWIPAPQDREGCETLREGGLEALMRIVKINDKAVPNLAELPGMATVGIDALGEDPAFNLQVTLERGAFETVALTIESAQSN